MATHLDDEIDSIVKHFSETIRRRMLGYEGLVRNDERRDHLPLRTFVDLVRANVDNDRLSDSEFREFIRRSL